MTGVSGLNVVKVTGNINLNNASLTFTGPADAVFIVNVAGSIKLGGHGGIHVGGAVPQTSLLINMTGDGKLIDTHVGNDIQGVLLGPKVGGQLDGAFGQLILGRDFTLLSGGQVLGCECPVD